MKLSDEPSDKCLTFIYIRHDWNTEVENFHKSKISFVFLYRIFSSLIYVHCTIIEISEMALTAKENQHNKSQPAGASAMTRSYSCHGCIMYIMKKLVRGGGIIFQEL